MSIGRFSAPDSSRCSTPEVRIRLGGTGRAGTVVWEKKGEAAIIVILACFEVAHNVFINLSYLFLCS